LGRKSGADPLRAAHVKLPSRTSGRGRCMWRRPLITRASILSARSACDYSKRIAARDRRNEAIKLRLMRRLKVKSGTVR